MIRYLDKKGGFMCNSESNPNSCDCSCHCGDNETSGCFCCDHGGHPINKGVSCSEEEESEEKD